MLLRLRKVPSSADGACGRKNMALKHTHPHTNLLLWQTNFQGCTHTRTLTQEEGFNFEFILMKLFWKGGKSEGLSDHAPLHTLSRVCSVHVHTRTTHARWSWYSIWTKKKKLYAQYFCADHPSLSRSLQINDVWLLSDIEYKFQCVCHYNLGLSHVCLSMHMAAHMYWK